MTPAAHLVKTEASDSEGKGVAVIIRKTFPQEELALKYARDLEAQVIQNGRQSDVPKEKIQAVALYERLVAKLSSYGSTPEEAVSHFLVHLGNEAAKQAKPFIRQLVDGWKQFKYADSTLSHRTVVEIRLYAHPCCSEARAARAHYFGDRSMTATNWISSWSARVMATAVCIMLDSIDPRAVTTFFFNNHLAGSHFCGD